MHRGFDLTVEGHPTHSPTLGLNSVRPILVNNTSSFSFVFSLLKGSRGSPGKGPGAFGGALGGPLKGGARYGRPGRHPVGCQAT